MAACCYTINHFSPHRLLPTLNMLHVSPKQESKYNVYVAEDDNLKVCFKLSSFLPEKESHFPLNRSVRRTHKWPHMVEKAQVSFLLGVKVPSYSPTTSHFTVEKFQHTLYFTVTINILCNVCACTCVCVFTSMCT
jgi:hypothetical protein